MISLPHQYSLLEPPSKPCFANKETGLEKGSDRQKLYSFVDIKESSRTQGKTEGARFLQTLEIVPRAHELIDMTSGFGS